MNMYELLVLAVGLSMDAFAVAICKGLAIRTVSLKHAAWVGLWFGGFQMLMPLLGFLLAHSFAQAIASFDHWIAFLLLAVIGGKYDPGGSVCRGGRGLRGFVRPGHAPVGHCHQH